MVWKCRNTRGLAVLLAQTALTSFSNRTLKGYVTYRRTESTDVCRS